MKKSPLFLIPNVTSAKNVGDAAMLEVLMGLMREAHPDCEIRLHSSEPHTHSYPQATSIQPTLYYWAVFENAHLLTRCRRMLRLSMVVIGLYCHLPLLVKLATFRSKTLKKLVQDFVQADMIVFVGGGYLRSKNGFSQSLNVLMNLYAFALANCVEGKKIVAPISIGPFAHAWHKRITARILRPMDVVAVREGISYAAMQTQGIPNLIRSCDHALLVPPHTNNKAHSVSPACIGFTIRDWLKPREQANLENAYVQALATIAQESGARIMPIVQVDAPHFGEGDAAVTRRIVAGLKELGIQPLPIARAQNVNHAKKVYGRLDLLLGMRMHSNILAAIQGVPFVAVSYEYKTEGIARDLGLHQFCLPCNQVTPQKLLEKVNQAYTNRISAAEGMQQKLDQLKKRETKRWLELLTL